MTKTFSVRASIEDIDKGDGDAFAQHVLSIWRRTEGNLTSEYIRAFPRMILFDGSRKVNDSPDLLECGEEALSVKILGDGWAENRDKAREFLGRDYCSVVGRDYFDATTQQLPMYSIVQAEMHNTAGTTINVRYQRLILPVRTMGGAHFLFGYSFWHQKERQVQAALPTSESPVRRKSETQDYANLFLSAQ